MTKQPGRNSWSQSAVGTNDVPQSSKRRQCTNHWRFAYRFARKYKTLALGMYPDVSLERARVGHEFARHLLTRGLDPSALKAAVRKQIFAATLREWERARGAASALVLRSQE